MAATQWKLAKGKTWRQKLQEPHPNHGKIIPLTAEQGRRLGGQSMLIPVPADVDAAMRRPRKGRLISTSQIRQFLLRDSSADSACPLTTGLFMRIVAEAAEEGRREGRKRITPYWRTIRDDGKLIEKFPGGAAAQAQLLRAEGFTIEPGRGKQPPKVQNFTKYLMSADA